MWRLWAVARQTFLECIRTRLAPAIFVLEMAGVLVMGLTFRGDGTLRGQIQTFLTYSLLLVQALLCVMTVFLATRIVANDVQKKSIFSVATKPLARWQYILGRWLGIVVLDALLLAAAMLAIYGVAEYQRGRPTDVELRQKAGRLPAGAPDVDRREVDNELFTARAVVSASPPSAEPLVQAQLKQLRDDNTLEGLIRQRIHQRLAGERSPTAAPPTDEEVDRQFRNQAVHDQTVEELTADLRKQRADEMLLVRPNQGLQLEFAGIKAGSAGDTLQLRYRLHAVSNPSDTDALRPLKAQFIVRNPESGQQGTCGGSSPADAASSFKVPPEFVTSDGKLTLFYINYADGPLPRSIKVVPDEITLMYRVSSFETNFIRAGLLILLRVMFLAAVGLMFGAFLSFPIACLACLLVLVITIMGSFLEEATLIIPGVNASSMDYFSRYLVKGVFLLVPNFAASSPVELVSDGANIPWATVLQEFLFMVEPAHAGWLGFQLTAGIGLRTLLALLLACVIFRYRELARVQV